LRFISIRRIIAFLLIIPHFLILFFINSFFLLLDELFFPKFRNQSTDKLLFIVGIPRSATTYLVHLLHNDKQQFTGYRLWEYLFAPSIIQKYLFIYLNKLNSFLGNPLKYITKRIDIILFRKTGKIHKMGLMMPDEDEFLFLYNFSSIYFYFFFPEVKALEPFVFHDTSIPVSVRKKNMDFFERCIQRHNYVFNRADTKYYISKSPGFSPKIGSIAQKFPQAKFINPIRTPFEAIPSAISLISKNYGMFCSMPVAYPMATETRDMLLQWYIHTNQLMKDFIKNRGIVLLFTDITGNTTFVQKQIYTFLNLETLNLIPFELNSKKKKSPFKSDHKYDRGTGIDIEHIKSKLEGVLPEALLY